MQKQNSRNLRRKVWYGRKNRPLSRHPHDGGQTGGAKAEIKKINKPAEQKKPGGFRFFRRPKKNFQPAKPVVTARSTSGVLRVIPLGGCEEVGRNMTVFEYLESGKQNGDIVIIDMGMQFPEEDMPGIDYIIPNTEYLKGKEKNIRGVIFTHGHLDHIGAAPLLLEKLGNPVIIGGKLTVHMIMARQEDHKRGTGKNLKTLIVDAYSKSFNLGTFRVSFFPVSHSIMDAMGIILGTPVATIVHPGDWKIEHGEGKIDYKHLAALRKPTVLMLESLGIAYKKSPVPEEEMYKNIEKIIKEAPGRIIVGTFSSMIERIKVILDIAEKYKKKVAVDGFSMRTNVELAKKIGYINFNMKNLVNIAEIGQLPDNQVIVMCTGAQGEERAVLNRIVNSEHRFIKFKKDDTVIFSSSVIPGNERTVQRLKDAIYRQCDNVIHSEFMDVHSGGHATAADIREFIQQAKPTFLVPVYANHYMLKETAKMAKKELGYSDKNILVPDNGSVLEFAKFSARILPKKIIVDPVFVDGLGVSDLQNVVLRDRQTLSEGGMVMVVVTISRRQKKLVRNPDIISRGFVYLKENKTLIDQTRAKVRKIVEGQKQKTKLPLDDDYLKDKIRNEVGQFLFSKTEKRPMILPVVIEV